MVDHQSGHFSRIRLDAPHPSKDLFELSEDMFAKDVTAGDWQAYSEYGEDPRGNEILPDRNSFLAHPFRRCACHREVADILTEAAYLHHLGESDQNTAVVYTGS